MKLSSLSIRKQEFSRTLRGYDTAEVTSFLSQAADDFEELQSENENLKKQLEDATDQLIEYRRIEKSLQDTLLKAQENSSKAIESTKKQSSLMLKEAEIKAQQIVDKAKETANEIRSSIVNLKEERDLLIAKLKAMITTQAHLLEAKVTRVEEEVKHEPKKETPSHLDINIDSIVEKLI